MVTGVFHFNEQVDNFEKINNKACLPWRKSDAMSYAVEQNFHSTFRTEVMSFHTDGRFWAPFLKFVCCFAQSLPFCLLFCLDPPGCSWVDWLFSLGGCPSFWFSRGVWSSDENSCISSASILERVNRNHFIFALKSDKHDIAHVYSEFSLRKRDDPLEVWPILI